MSVSRPIERTVDINKPIRCDTLGQIFERDSQAHSFQIAVVSNGSPVNLAGYSAVAYFNRPTSDTVTFTGTVSGNVVTVVLPEACYAYQGHFNLVIKVTDGDESRVTIYWAEGNVRPDANAGTVEPGEVVPDLTTLLAQMEQTSKCLKAKSTVYVSATDGQTETVQFDIYAMAGTPITITQKVGRIAAGGTFNVLCAPADPGESSVGYGGSAAESKAFTFTVTPTINVSRVTLTMTAGGTGRHRCEIEYTPGANDRPSLTLYDINGAVTITAAQLRQLLGTLQ